MKLQVFEKEKVITYNGTCNIKYLIECIQTLRPNDWFDFSLVADTVIETINYSSPLFYRPLMHPTTHEPSPNINPINPYTICNIY